MPWEIEVNRDLHHRGELGGGAGLLQRDLRVIPRDNQGVTGASWGGCGPVAFGFRKAGSRAAAQRRDAPSRLPLPTRRASSHRPAAFFSPTLPSLFLLS